MTPEAREARAAYKRAWSRANRDKVRAHQERYWERMAQKQQEAQDAQDAQEAGHGES